MNANSTSQKTTSEINSKELRETQETFQWTKQWYPVAVIECLDPSKPHSIELLGKNLVL